MFIPRFHIVLLVLGLGLMQIGSAQGATSTIYIPTETQSANGTNYPVNPAVNNVAVLAGQAIPSLWQTGTTMKIMAARGEIEPATFLLDTDVNLTAVNVQLGSLTGTMGEGTLAAETLDVRVVQPYYKRVTDFSATVPWVLTRDPSIFSIVDGVPPWVSEVTLPLHHHLAAIDKVNILTKPAIDTATLQSADVTSRQQFWITANIPENATPGTYTAPVTVVSDNAADMVLTLEVRVPNLTLKEPNFEYSVYYPAHLLGTVDPSSTIPQLTDTQYVNEMRNMKEHGLTNPNYYRGVNVNPDSTLDFTPLERQTSLREQAGMDLQGKPLYIASHTLGFGTSTTTLSQAEYARNVDHVQQIVAWASAKGYGDVYFSGDDEKPQDPQLGAYQSIHDGGGKVFQTVLGAGGISATALPELDAPVLAHPGLVAFDAISQSVTGEQFLLDPVTMETYADPALMMTGPIQAEIADIHANGNKAFTYMDPIAGQTAPGNHRRSKGLGLWKTNVDGTMTWAYTHPSSNNAKFVGFDPSSAEDVLTNLYFDLVFRGEEAPFDTLGFEGFREGVDDARYLATLQAAISAATALGQNGALIGTTQTWLDNLNATTADMDAVRLEMAALIELIAPVPGDFSANGSVGLEDYLIMESNWLSTGNVWNQNGDLTGPLGTPDGIVDLYDFFEFKDKLFPGGSSGFASALASAVPEPGSASLTILALITLALVGRRRK